MKDMAWSITVKDRLGGTRGQYPPLPGPPKIDHRLLVNFCVCSLKDYNHYCGLSLVSACALAGKSFLGGCGGCWKFKDRV